MIRRRATERRSALELRRALLEERGDALLGVGGGRRRRHDLPGVLVGGGLAAGRSGGRTLACPTPSSAPTRASPAASGRRRRSSSSSSGTTRLIRPHSAAVAASIASPVNAISSARLRPIVAGDGDERGVAEQPALAAGNGEAGRVGGDGEVAAGDELAPGGGRQRVHPRAHRLRHRLDRRHHLRADVEDLLRLLERGAGHVAEVVPGREHRPASGDDDPECVAVAGAAQRLGERRASRRQRGRCASRDDRA